MAYGIMKTLIDLGKTKRERLVELANVYVAAEQLSKTEYLEIMSMIP